MVIISKKAVHLRNVIRNYSYLNVHLSFSCCYLYLNLYLWRCSNQTSYRQWRLAYIKPVKHLNLPFSQLAFAWLTLPFASNAMSNPRQNESHMWNEFRYFTQGEGVGIMSCQLCNIDIEYMLEDWGELLSPPAASSTPKLIKTFDAACQVKELLLSSIFHTSSSSSPDNHWSSVRVHSCH